MESYNKSEVILARYVNKRWLTSQSGKISVCQTFLHMGNWTEDLEDLLLAPGINEISLVSSDNGYYSGLWFSRAVLFKRWYMKKFMNFFQQLSCGHLQG